MALAIKQTLYAAFLVPVGGTYAHLMKHCAQREAVANRTLRLRAGQT